MGADGGYYYIQKSDLRLGLSEKDINLFIKFTEHSLFKDTWKEDNDPEEYEATMKGVPYRDWLRYPYGTDLDDSLGIGFLSEDEHYSNPPEEVWYYREFISENRNRGHYYWWEEPVSWYVWGHSDVQDDSGWFKPLVTVPTPDELKDLVRITSWISERHCVSYFETWT